MNRFFTEAGNVEDGIIKLDTKEDIHHISKVLRLKVGDEIEISDSAQWEYLTEIISISPNCIETKIIDKQKFAREPETFVSLYQGIPKQGKMELIIQKTVELGVSEIIPVFMERTVVADKGNFGKKLERWQKVSQEAVKQCKRGVVPEICKEMQFNEMVNRAVNSELIILAYENEENYSIKDCLRNLEFKPKSVALIIGPEGGFSDSEVKFLKEIGAKCVSLGKTILRTETAGLAALAMLMYELEL